MQGSVPYWGAGGVVDYVDTAIFNEPLVLVGEDGAPFFTFGKDVAYYIEGPSWINNHIHALRPTNCDGRYLSYALNTVDYARYVTGSTRDKLTQDDLKEISIPYPPLDEQRRIADYLDRETGRIESLTSTQRIARSLLLEHRKVRVFNSVTGRHIAQQVDSRIPWTPTIPNTWQSVKLSHFARMGSGHTPSRNHPEWWESPTIPWITTGEVSQVRDDRQEVLSHTRELISELGLANSSAEIHPKATVVLCRTASAGYSAVMGAEMATSQDFVTWTCGPRLNPFYLLWCLRAMRSDLLGRLAMGSTHKTIYVPDLQMLRIPLPSIDEQDRIVNSIREGNSMIDNAVDLVDRQLALLAERRQALIITAITGQIDVTTARGVSAGGVS